MSHTTRAIPFATLIGLALSGPAGASRLMGGFQAWLTQIMAASGDAGSIMDPNGSTRSLLRSDIGLGTAWSFDSTLLAGNEL